MSVATREREKLTRLASDMRRMLNAAKGAGGHFTSADRETYEKLRTAYEETELEVKRIELSAPLGGSRNDITTGFSDGMRDNYKLRPQDRDNSPHGVAFNKYLRAGIAGLDSDEQRAFVLGGAGLDARNTMSTTTGSQGGFVVPIGFSDQLTQAMLWFGGIDGVVGKFQTATGNSLNWPTINDTSNRGRIIGQNVQLTETDLVFNQVQFSAYIGSSDLVLVPLALLEDSFFDLSKLLAELLGVRLGRLMNYWCTVGAGGGSGPTGIVTAVVASGNVYNMPAGETSSVTYADLVAIEHSVDPIYRYSPSTYWMFSDKMLKTIKSLTDTQGRPLWQPGISASFRSGAGIQGLTNNDARPTILDHPYILNADMSSPAANAYSILFGDCSLFKVREVSAEDGGVSILTLRERYADYLQTGFLAFKRFDSQLINAGTNPIVVARQSAS